MEVFRLTLGASGPPGVPKDGGAARIPLAGFGEAGEALGTGGLQPSVLNGACGGGCLGLSSINISLGRPWPGSISCVCEE